MSLNDLLLKRQTAIRDKWIQRIFQTYSADGSSFLGREKNRFANPVGHTIRESVGIIVERFLAGAEPSELVTPLEDIVRIRAVQDFSPSQVVGFVFLLKSIIRDELGEDLRGGPLSEELERFDLRIDEMALLTFDSFMKFRERIYELKVNETKRNVRFLLDRANEMYIREEQELPVETTPDV